MTMPTTRRESRRLILLADDPPFGGRSLSEILERAEYELVTLPGGISVPEGIAGLTSAPDLMIALLDGADGSCVDQLRQLRATPRARQVPILGVTTFQPHCLDIRLLRSCGVVGLIDRRASGETVVSRVDQAVRRIGPDRIAERALCFFPVEVERDGRVEAEHALDLSASGMRITAADCVEPNTDLGVRFQLPMVSRDVIDVRIRVVRRSSKRNSAGRHEVGAFFYPMDLRLRDIIEREVLRLLVE